MMKNGCLISGKLKLYCLPLPCLNQFPKYIVIENQFTFFQFHGVHSLFRKVIFYVVYSLGAIIFFGIGGS